jgi:alanyl-tRNA synthetase
LVAKIQIAVKSQEIRRKFLDFFASKSHQIVPSAPLVIKNDPTLMFTNAGMNQFKDYFLGNSQPVHRRIADTQKCLRVSGKHNDLEDVGMDGTHHTMFEMLGNWSFGDYFKAEAIEWSWQLLTEVYGLPKDRLYATVFGGDATENLSSDEEAKALWKKYLPENHIIYGNKKDNFWEMGETGPCGPCSEIHIDLRPQDQRDQIAGEKLVNQDHPLVVEIWNNVFMEFERKADRSLVYLPAKHVDTGMGFERLCMVIQGKDKTYDSDVFSPLIQFIENQTKIKYTSDYSREAKSDIAMRVMADHIRAIAFAIADGQLPSNNKAGYVIRRILRRAVRYGFSFLGIKEPFLYQLVEVLAAEMGTQFPEIQAQSEFIQKVVAQEEKAFLATLENGLSRLEQIMRTEKKRVEGKIAFELYDTFGFPYDLTDLIARENGLEVDKEGFEKALLEQKERSRADAASAKGDWTLVNEGDEVEFVGYHETESVTKILKYREIEEKKRKFYQIVLETTPFYPEGGGQVGDKGLLVVGDEKIEIFDTKKENNLIVHFATRLPSNPQAQVKCFIDKHLRSLTENNHSATHLLHAALRRVLGTHIAQKGSLVNSEILRFDFSHFEKISASQLEEIEKIVNAKIRENIPLQEAINVPIEKAIQSGATALFGEKYGDFVRVITFDPAFSVELCGGTHVSSTSKIGFFKLLSESSVAAGVRRIEAITSLAAEAYLSEQLNTFKSIKEALKNPKDPLKALNDLFEEKAQLQKEIERLQQKELLSLKAELLTKIENLGELKILAQQVEVPHTESLKTLSFQLRQQFDDLVSVLVSQIDGKAHIALMICDKLVEERQLDAAQIIKNLAQQIQGGGGGQKFFATAAGKQLDAIPKVLELGKKMVS